MKNYQAKQIRNVALLGHGSSGKTTFVESLAYSTGAIDRMGKVEEGGTLSDHYAEEVKHKMSISTSVISLEYDGYKLNILDVPGYFDFTGEVSCALHIADAAIIIIDASTGVEIGALKAIEQVQAKGIPCILAVNKNDRENADFYKVVDELKEILGEKAVPLVLPKGQGPSFEGVVDIVDFTDNKGIVDLSDSPLDEDTKMRASDYEEMILENVAQTSEEFIEKYLNGDQFSPEEIYEGLRQSISSKDMFPIVPISAINNQGTDRLLKIITKLCPSPSEANNNENAVFVFKTLVDPFVGRLSIFKVISGCINNNMELINYTSGKKERVSHIYVLRGKKQIEVDKLEAGDIGAFSKLSATFTNDILCDAPGKIEYPKISFPEPMLSMAVKPKAKGDEDKISSGLSRLQEEDPTIKVYRNDETKETILSGIGEMQLEIVCEKMQSRFGVEMLLELPQIPYKETIKKKVTAEGKHKKQSGGRGQFGHVFIEFEPTRDYDQRLEFVDKIVGGAVPRNFIPAVEKGLCESIEEGVLAGYPVTGLRATLFDGSFHSVDSDEMSFKIAANLAYKKGLSNAEPILLEPIYELEITTPEQYTGEVIGDINKKRGKVLGMDMSGSSQKIIAEVPLAEIRKYATELRSITQAQGTFTMKFKKYEEVPEQIAEKIMSS